MILFRRVLAFLLLFSSPARYQWYQLSTANPLTHMCVLLLALKDLHKKHALICAVWRPLSFYFLLACTATNLTT